jgi:molecular chaperone IbpA
LLGLESLSLIEVKRNNLTVSVKKETPHSERNFLHQGIAAINFERRFQLEDYVKVEGARLENGLLYVDLVREIPEAMKPRAIDVRSGSRPASSSFVKDRVA